MYIILNQQKPAQLIKVTYGRFLSFISWRMAMQMIAIVLTIFFLAVTSGAPAKEKEIKVNQIQIRIILEFISKIASLPIFHFQPICPPIKLTPRSDVIITMNMISDLGINVLPDQHLCFFGRLMNGIVLPRNHLLQIPILKGLLTWYSPCLLVDQGYFKLDENCFDERESQFLGTFMNSVLNFTTKPMNSRNLL